MRLIYDSAAEVARLAWPRQEEMLWACQTYLQYRQVCFRSRGFSQSPLLLPQRQESFKPTRQDLRDPWPSSEEPEPTHPFRDWTTAGLFRACYTDFVVSIIETSQRVAVICEAPFTKFLGLPDCVFTLSAKLGPKLALSTPNSETWTELRFHSLWQRAS